MVERELPGAARGNARSALARNEKRKRRLTRERKTPRHSTRYQQHSRRTVHPAQLVLRQLAVPLFLPLFETHQDDLRRGVVRRSTRGIEQLSFGLERSHAEVAELDAEAAAVVLVEEEVFELESGGQLELLGSNAESETLP